MGAQQARGIRPPTVVKAQSVKWLTSRVAELEIALAQTQETLSKVSSELSEAKQRIRGMKSNLTDR